MRLFRIVAAAACLCVLYAFPAPSFTAAAGHPALRAMRGEKDVLYAAPGDANYSYGPKLGVKRALRSSPAAAMTATFQVSYDAGFQANPQAQAAFQAAVDIWSQIIVSPAPIRVRASFAALPTGVLGSAGPTSICFVNPPFGVANMLYAAALADKLVGSQSCASANFETAEIDAQFSSTRPDWDFGTTGTGVGGKFNFMTVVLHELGHGLGFYGSGISSGGIGSFFYVNQGFPDTYDIFDRFVFNGFGTPIINFPNNSAALHAQLVGNNLFFDGANTRARNSGQAGKIEAHNFNTDYGVASADNGFLRGSSYSHTDDVLYSRTPNGLMTWAIQANEVYTDPGPLMRGMFEDEGWSIAPTCTFSITPTSVTAPAAGTSGTIALTTQAGCAWTASSNNPAIAAITSATSGTGSAVINYTVSANAAVGPRSTTLTIGGQTFTINQNGTGPLVSLDRTSLAFGAVSNGAAFTSQTPTQVIRITQASGAGVPWTATSNAPWLQIATGSTAPSSSANGVGPAAVSVTVQFVAGLQPTQTGQIAFTFAGAGNTAGPVTVTLSVRSPAAAASPAGFFDSPANGTTGVSGSLAVSGWALDDVGVSRVTICRDLVAGESVGFDPNCNGPRIFIGDAVFIDGARPDVQAANPGVPQNTRAGWGYLLLTNFLPNNGNGTFTLRAYAKDLDGHTIELSSAKTITVDNLNATRPFGAIDHPTQGQVVCGTFINDGWVLTQPGKDIPADSSTIIVAIDNVAVGHPGARAARSDITGAFAASGSNTTHAAGGYGLDTTTLSNGTHTIFWFVTDSAGQSDGIGSRFFTVSNPCPSGLQADPNGIDAAPPSNVVVSTASLQVPADVAASLAGPIALTAEIDAAPADLASIRGRRGFDLATPLSRYVASAGRITVQGEEVDRLELQLAHGHGEYAGYLRTAAGVMPLPIGSHLDAAAGTFTWAPGAGFIGGYDLVFVRWSGGRAVARQEIRIVLNPKGSNRVGPQTIIDVPVPAANGIATVGSSFFLSGWAADLDSAWDRGVDAVHVWAYPVNEAGQREQPLFLGAAVDGGARPDVAAVYGDRFGNSGYGLVVKGLAPGVYDIAVFAYSTVVGNFTSAKIVRVIVR